MCYQLDAPIPSTVLEQRYRQQIELYDVLLSRDWTHLGDIRSQTTVVQFQGQKDLYQRLLEDLMQRRLEQSSNDLPF